jgi:hypothetical protein
MSGKAGSSNHMRTPPKRTARRIVVHTPWKQQALTPNTCGPGGYTRAALSTCTDLGSGPEQGAAAVMRRTSVGSSPVGAICGHCSDTRLGRLFIPPLGVGLNKR